jgi:hypothetical protein
MKLYFQIVTSVYSQSFEFDVEMIKKIKMDGVPEENLYLH